MSEYTEHYNLKKPAGSENYNVEDANTNNTIIDNVLFGKVDKRAGKDLSTNDFTDGYKKKIDSMQTLYRFKGTIETINDLSNVEDITVGDVYRCKADSNNYIWNGQEWVNAGQDADFEAIAKQMEELTPHKYFMKVTTTIKTDTNFTIPCLYKVGANVLDVYLMGEKLIKTTEEHAGHYKEVGEVGSISNTIQLDSINEDGTSEDWQADVGEYFEFIVRGEYNET